MLLAHHRDLVDRLRAPTAADPWRVLLSGCMAGWGCGIDGTDYGMGAAASGFAALPTLRFLPFCPEKHALGVPRTMPDIHGGDGFDVLAGRAKVLDEKGADLTAAMIEGARAMLAFARAERVELALLTDMSAACGTQVISDGCRLVPIRRFRKGVGVAAAMLLEAQIPVVSQRDFFTLGQLRARLEPGHVPEPSAKDHHEHPWTLEHLPGPHPRA
jgi:uncharacterized protein YbbK (DUF523 family)